MKQELFFGKLFPSHPQILPILNDIREKYQIPEISPKVALFYTLKRNLLLIDYKVNRINSRDNSLNK